MGVAGFPGSVNNVKKGGADIFPHRCSGTFPRLTGGRLL